MNQNLIEKIDQTIEVLCERAESKAKYFADTKEVSEITNALAALITARANVTTYENRMN